MKKGKWRRLYSTDGKLLYQGFTLHEKPYGVGKAYYENGKVYQEGIFGLKGLICGREYYPDGSIRFEGEYSRSVGYGTNYPNYGKCFSLEKKQIVYEGNVNTYLDREGSPIVDYPKSFVPIPEDMKPQLQYFAWDDAAEEKIFTSEYNNIHCDYKRRRYNNKAYNIELQPRPVKENFFQDFIVNTIINLRDVVGEYLSIGFSPERDDNITCIQTCRNDDNYRVEVVVNFHDEQAFHIMALDNVSLDDTIKHFKNVCVDFNGINISEWRDVSKEVNYSKDDKEKSIRGRSCPLCKKHFFSNPYIYEVCPFCGWEQKPKTQKTILKSKWLDIIEADKNKSAVFTAPIKDTVRAILINTIFGMIKARYNNVLIDFALNINKRLILGIDNKSKYGLCVMLNVALLSKYNMITLGFDKRTFQYKTVVDDRFCIVCEHGNWLLCMLPDNPTEVLEKPNCELKYSDRGIAYVGTQDKVIDAQLYKESQILSVHIIIIKKSTNNQPDRRWRKYKI